MTEQQQLLRKLACYLLADAKQQHYQQQQQQAAADCSSLLQPWIPNDESNWRLLLPQCKHVNIFLLRHCLTLLTLLLLGWPLRSCVVKQGRILRAPHLAVHSKTGDCVHIEPQQQLAIKASLKQQQQQQASVRKYLLCSKILACASPCTSSATAS
jgi:hypothetical protein